MKKVTIIIASVVLVLLLAVGAYFLFIRKANEITIMFDTDGGSALSSMKVTKDKEVTLPMPTKEGFTFNGWFKDNQQVNNPTKFSEDTLLKAHWNEIKKTYTITFDTKGGSKMESLTVECGKELKLPTNKPTKKDYNFVSWADKNGKVIQNGALLTCEDITLYANWEGVTKTFKVTFDSKGGSKVNNLTITCGKTLPKLTTPTKSGYAFVAWTDKNGKTIGDGAKLSCENITLYADWKAYKCPTNYTLSGTKCKKEVAASERCPSGTKVDGSLCINTSVSNGGTRVCKSDTVSIDGKGHTWTGKGDYHYNGSYGKCAYYKWTSYTTKTQCENANDTYHRTTWVSDLNACYAEDKMNNYEIVCSSDYKYYSSDELKTKFSIYDNGKCLKKVAKEKYCNSPYTLTNGKCVQTIDATLS